MLVSIKIKFLSI